MKISIAQAKYRALDFDKCIADFKINYYEALLRGSDVLVFPSMFLGNTKYGEFLGFLNILKIYVSSLNL